MNSGVFADPKFAKAKPFSEGARPDVASTLSEFADDDEPPPEHDATSTADITSAEQRRNNIGSTVTDSPMRFTAGRLLRG